MFDLSQYELNETSVMVVRNARDDDDLIGADGTNPVTITFYGSGSEQFAKAEHKANNASTARLQAAFRGQAVKNQSELSQTELAQKLAACTASIDNFPVAPLDLFKNNKLSYIRKQAIRFLEADANFSKG
ncbi:MAG: hypothetical protein KA751_10405 [Comamonas sp.]|nr:hypothetical protein [Comamonas sp.]